MRDEDFVGCSLVYPDRVGQTHVIKHVDRHEWMYLLRSTAAAYVLQSRVVINQAPAHILM